MLKMLIILGLFVPSRLTENATAITAHEFLTESGEIYAVHDNLKVGEAYEVTFRTFKTKSRLDDVIVRFKEI